MENGKIIDYLRTYLLIKDDSKIIIDGKVIEYQQVVKELKELLEIIKQNPELVWWCCCYKTAAEMICDRKGFMLDYDMEEIRRQFNIVKEFLENE